jgi:hypothetical protein
MSTFKKVKAVVGLYGDCVSHGEINISCVYIFGEYFYISNSFDDTFDECLCEAFNIGTIKHNQSQAKDDLDAAITTIVADFYSDYGDIVVTEILVELDDEGSVINTFLSI